MLRWGWILVDYRVPSAEWRRHSFFSWTTPFCRRDTLVLTYGQMALFSRPSNKLTRQFFGQVASPQTSLFLASRGHRMCDFRRSTSLLLSPYRKSLFQTLRPGISALQSGTFDCVLKARFLLFPHRPNIL